MFASPPCVITGAGRRIAKLGNWTIDSEKGDRHSSKDGTHPGRRFCAPKSAPLGGERSTGAMLTSCSAGDLRADRPRNEQDMEKAPDSLLRPACVFHRKTAARSGRAPS
mmetsp:Transcript_96876/g.216015  ORF Transcript_96876/g.216015 Transcript_96876/m.216015 type:complete len:109 (-) Transcript_96876:36-362(-)